MASIRRRGGRYQVRGTGIRSKTFTRAEDAKLYKADQERRVALGELYVAPAESFGAVLDSYLERCKPSWRPKTYRNKLDDKKNLASLKSLRTQDVTRAELEDLIHHIARQGRTGTPAPRMAQTALQLAKAVLRDCQMRRIPIDPAALTIPVPKYDEREGMFLVLEDVYELASRMPGFIQRIVLVAALTGMRQGELLALQTGQLSLDQGTLWVPRGKTENARRTVYLSAKAVTLIREQLVQRPAKDTEYVFSAPEGGALNKNNLMERYFRPATRAAGFDGFTFHDLKHTFVSLAAKARTPREVVAVQVGWSLRTVDAMYERYRHVYPEEIAEAVAAMDAVSQ